MTSSTKSKGFSETGAWDVLENFKRYKRNRFEEFYPYEEE